MQSILAMATFGVLHVEKDDQVRQLGNIKLHNNTSHLVSIIFVKQVKISHNYEVSIFVLLLGLLLRCLLFCTILTPSKIMAAVSPFTYSFICIDDRKITYL
jgi:hypothetical protein